MCGSAFELCLSPAEVACMSPPSCGVPTNAPCFLPHPPPLRYMLKDHAVFRNLELYRDLLLSLRSCGVDACTLVMEGF